MRCLAALIALVSGLAPTASVAAAEPTPPASPTLSATAPTALELRREALFRTFQKQGWKDASLVFDIADIDIVGDMLWAVALTPAGLIAAGDDRPEVRPLAVPLTTSGGIALVAGVTGILLDGDSPWRRPIVQAGFEAAHATAYLGLALADERYLPGVAPLVVAGYAGAGLRLLEAALRPGLPVGALRRDAAMLADPIRYLGMTEDDIARVEGHLARHDDHWPGWVRASPHLLAAVASLAAALVEDEGEVRAIDAVAALPSLLMAVLVWGDADLLPTYRSELERGARGLEIDLVIGGTSAALVGSF